MIKLTRYCINIVHSSQPIGVRARPGSDLQRLKARGGIEGGGGEGEIGPSRLHDVGHLQKNILLLIQPQDQSVVLVKA